MREEKDLNAFPPRGRSRPRPSFSNLSCPYNISVTCPDLIFLHKEKLTQASLSHYNPVSSLPP
jgi:hypothetical protein